MLQPSSSAANVAGMADPALMEAAQRAIEAHGYSGATLERIAEQAGVSRVTLHRRGVSKDGLLADLVAQATEDYRAAMWPALTGDGTGADRLHAALEALCGAAERHLALLVALRAQSDGVFHRREDASLTRGVWTAPIERLLRDGAADGSLRQVDPAETATLLFNMVGWTYVHLRTAHGWNPERVVSAVLDPILHGLLA
jgi:AcrR family transcriptional regulator